MRVLLILPRYDLAVASASINFGMAYICSVLRRAGHKVEILDTDPIHIDMQGIEKRIREAECDVIGLGGLSAVFNFIEWAVSFIRKTRPNIPIILGGGIFSAAPELIFNHLKPDYGVIGEGEETIVELIDYIDNEFTEGDISKVDGIMHVGGKTARRKPIMDLDTLPWPAWDDFGIEEIIQGTSSIFTEDKDKGRRRMQILSSRSCPFLCFILFPSYGQHIPKAFSREPDCRDDRTQKQV